MTPAQTIFAQQTVENTRLHFSGELTWGIAGLAALVLGLLAWWLYRGDLKGRTGRVLWLIPLLRVLAIAAVIMMLSGPVLKHTKTVGTTARVLLYVDGSASMKATDEQMEVTSKLKIIRRLGWLTGEAPADHVGDALDRLGDLKQFLARIESGTTRDLPENVRQSQAIAQQAMDYLAELSLKGWTPDEVKAFRAEVFTPVQKLNPERVSTVELANVITLRPKVADWEDKLIGLMPSEESVISGLDADTQAALERFDRTPRWQRLEAQLLGGADSVVDQLAAKHNVELLALTGRRFQMLWHPNAIGEVSVEAEGDAEFLPPPKTLNVAVTNMITDLATAIEEGEVGDTSKEKLIVVLITDGQHNVDGSSPVEMARVFRDRGVAIHTVGMGTVEPARDLAVVKTESPNSVYPDARLTGHVILHDGMPPGKPFTVRIEHQGRVVWSQDFATAQTRRKIPFDFAIKDIVVAEQASQSRDIRYANLPLALNVVVPPIEGEMKDDNNVGVLRVNVVTQKPRILVLDSRPRWEFRYLRNLLERDQRWDANIILCDWAAGGPVLRQRGNQAGRFPATREMLFQYQLVLLGDVPPGVFTKAELTWLKQFVQFNGGGLICIDGRMEGHYKFAATDLRELYPVQFLGAPALNSMDLELRFRNAGGAQAPLMLAANTAANLRIWNDLPAPRWAAATKALPGSETLLEILDGNTAVPGLVFRRYGAGRVLYSAFDESWRWRYNVGDQHHQRYWNQVSKWIMEPPFSVQDAYIALDSGPTQYDVKDTAEIRVRVMNPDLALQFSKDPKLRPQALLFRDGQLFGTFPLEPDPESFTFRARSAPLEPGEYEVRVRLPGVPDDAIKATTAFTVASNPFGELGRLHCDELLLKQIASDSGGSYHREEAMRRLIDTLAPASDRSQKIEELALWQSYWWFIPVILLLTAEWVLRRVKGMV